MTTLTATATIATAPGTRVVAHGDKAVMLDAHMEWAKRPADERFTSLGELYNAVAQHDVSSFTGLAPLTSLVPMDQGGHVVLNGGTALTYHSFGRLAEMAGLGRSKSDLRRMPAPLAAANLRWGLEDAGKSYTRKEEDGTTVEVRPEVKVIGQRNRGGVATTLMGLVTPSFGIIKDRDVVKAVMDVNERCGGLWRVPTGAYGEDAAVTKDNTTLYASDHDIFMFLVDGERTIEGKELGNAALNRGFIVRNSEVNDGRALSIKTFWFNRVCQNRMIWGAANILEILVRHTQGGPARFATEAPPVLLDYAGSSAQELTETVGRARELLPVENPTISSVTDYLRKQAGVTKGIAERAALTAEKMNPADGLDESSAPFSLWNLVQAGTATARDIVYTDERAEVEERFSGLLKLAAGK